MRNSPVPLNIIEPTFDIHSNLSSSSSLSSSLSCSSSPNSLLLSKSSLLLFHHYYPGHTHSHSHQRRQDEGDNLLLATSAFVLPGNKLQPTNQKLCSDRKGFLDHLKPRSLIISTLRVSSLQISQILTSYITDQIHHESSLDKELQDGNISLVEFEQRSHDWEEIEWSKRWKTFPHKLQTALVKYHTLILTMRLYEYMIGRFVKDGMFLLDRLTKDAFKVAIAKSHDWLPGDQSSFVLKRQGESYSSKNYAMEMFETCIYSNAISFLADYSIQQGILIYGYYMYMKNVQRRNSHIQRIEKYGESNDLQSLNLDYELVPSVQDDLVLPEEEQTCASVVGEGAGGEVKVKEKIQGEQDHHHQQKEEQQQEQNQNEWNASLPPSLKDIVPHENDQSGGLILSFIYNSSQLFVSKAIGLFMAGVGGALGSLIRPGWGTVVGVQLGDASVSALLDSM